jgi:hypothetical protein
LYSERSEYERTFHEDATPLFEDFLVIGGQKQKLYDQINGMTPEQLKAKENFLIEPELIYQHLPPGDPNEPSIRDQQNSQICTFSFPFQVVAKKVRKKQSIVSFNDVILNQEATTHSTNYFILAHNSVNTTKISTDPGTINGNNPDSMKNQ